MQSIERYGVIALLFLVVTVVAVLMWDTEEDAVATTKTSRAAIAAQAPSATGSKSLTGSERRTTARTSPEARPLTRATQWSEPPSSDNLPPSAAQDSPSVAVRVPERASKPVPDEAEAREAAARRTTPANKAKSTERTSSKLDRIYVIRPGDTLGEIALQKLGTSKRWPEIVQANPGLDPARLKVGARLVLPPGATSSSAPEASSTSKGGPGAEPAGGTYRVRPGDNLWNIAESELGDGELWKEIVLANPGLDPERLLVGKVLALPAGTAARKPAPQVAKAGEPQAERRGRVR